jgi:L-ascorbate metabolism protein UlaG (beta-lactamase superfamily)
MAFSELSFASCVTMTSFLSNPDLPTLFPEWKGTPMNHAGRFFLPHYPFLLKWQDVFKWKMSKNPYAPVKKLDKWVPKVHLDEAYLIKENSSFLVWLGHASFYFRINGLSFLIDPVIGKLSPFMPRYSEFPIAPQKLNNFDILLITHDHRDHCDDKSLKLIGGINSGMQVFTGLNMKPLLRSWVKNQPITEMGWYQQVVLPVFDIKITFLPTRHWSRRWFTDTNTRLWGAFVVETPDLCIYFGGDSGYGSHFLKTATLFPKIDYAILGIGAFAPEWFMSSNHMSPGDALVAFRDLKAGKLIPMHYGTFDLSDEPLGEPIRLLKELASEQHLEDKLCEPEIGLPLFF